MVVSVLDTLRGRVNPDSVLEGGVWLVSQASAHLGLDLVFTSSLLPGVTDVGAASKYTDIR